MASPDGSVEQPSVERTAHGAVALKTGERVVLYDAAIKGDSLVGFLSASPTAPNDRRAVATSDITEVAYLAADAVATALAFSVIVIAVVAIAAAGASASTNNGTCQPTYYRAPAT